MTEVGAFTEGTGPAEVAGGDEVGGAGSGAEVASPLIVGVCAIVGDSEVCSDVGAGGVADKASEETMLDDGWSAACICESCEGDNSLGL